MKFNECLEHVDASFYSDECAECAYDQEVYETTFRAIERIRERWHNN